jgi:hypothetical protein
MSGEKIVKLIHLFKELVFKHSSEEKNGVSSYFFCPLIPLINLFSSVIPEIRSEFFLCNCINLV